MGVQKADYTVAKALSQHFGLLNWRIIYRGVWYWPSWNTWLITEWHLWRRKCTVRYVHRALPTDTACSGYSLGSHPSGTWPGHLPGEVRGTSGRCLGHLSWPLSMWRSSGVTPSSSWMTELAYTISKGLPHRSVEETHFSCLFWHFFGHNPKFMTVDVGRNVDWPIKKESLP